MNISFRQAEFRDLPEIVRMLADDFLGGQRERFEEPLPESYVKAFREIEADPNNELIVAVRQVASPVGDASGAQLKGTDRAEAHAGETPAVQSQIVGTMQLTFTPSISFQGGKRATVESVRVDGKYRGQGIGEGMMRWAIERAKEKGCVSMQLTTNLERTDAHRFYERLGFSRSHLGMKLKLQ
jgi:GNAT superfamily N-acetyltransferase